MCLTDQIFALDSAVDTACMFIVYCCSHCLWRFCVRSLFCYPLLCILSSFEK